MKSKAGIPVVKGNQQDSVDALRWRAVKLRHSVALCRVATNSVSYSSEKVSALLDAWADMAHAEMDAFDPDTYRKEVEAQIEGMKKGRSR